MNKKLFLPLLLLALLSMACGITINLPVDEVTAGPTIEEQIVIPEPDSQDVDLKLNFGAGKLELEGGAVNALVEGTATYNVDGFKPKVTVEDNEVTLETGNLEIEGIPNFGGDIKNIWDLKLSSMPMNLSLSAGAYEAEIDLGGLAIQMLEVSDGAATVDLDFSSLNLVEMSTLRYSTGASNVKLTGLGNANLTSLIFRCGAGDYSLDFSGAWQRDAVVSIESGISQIRLLVPEGLSARVIFKGGMTSVDADDAWEKDGDEYILNGSGPTLLINVDMGAGNLKLETIK